ncbi:MAG: hypothetical protein ACK4GO_08165 [Gemmobacter sp.]
MTKDDDADTAALLERLRSDLSHLSDPQREAACLRVAAALVQEAAYLRAGLIPPARLVRLVSISAELGSLADEAGRDAGATALRRRLT